MKHHAFVPCIYKRKNGVSSLLRKVITPKGRFSENTLMVMLNTNLRPFNARTRLQCLGRVFAPCQNRSIADEKIPTTSGVIARFVQKQSEEIPFLGYVICSLCNASD